jgi:hypothetical protein
LREDLGDFLTRYVIPFKEAFSAERDYISFAEILRLPEDPTVLLSFACDPYQPIEEELKITQKCLELFVQFGVPVQILTKGCKLAVRDFDLLAHSSYNRYAVTLTHTDDEVLSRIEPGASTYQERLSSLRLAKELGISTWVSLEPVIDFNETYKIIEDTKEFVDHYKVGKLNHDPYADKLDWRDFKEEVIYRLAKTGKSYYLKEDLRKF